MRHALIAVIGASGLLAGCLPCGLSICPAPSAAYRQVEGLDYAERDAALMRMSVEQRLDAYHDVYVRSGHPKRMLTGLFEGTGEAGVEAAMARMTDRSSFNEYFGIIHVMGLRDEVDICQSRIFNRLAEKARQFRVVDPEHPIPVEFDGCVLPL